MQYGLIQELILYELLLGHNAVEASQNICCMKGEATGDCSTVTR